MERTSAPRLASSSCWDRDGVRSRTMARARCNALLTDATVVSSSSATSRAEKVHHLTQHEHGTLHRRQLLHRRDEGELHPLPRHDTSLRRQRVQAEAASGYGSSHSVSLAGIVPGERSVDSSRRFLDAIAVRHLLVAILYSHGRTDCRPSKRAIDRQARSNDSCTTSSASCTEPSVR